MKYLQTSRAQHLTQGGRANQKRSQPRLRRGGRGAGGVTSNRAGGGGEGCVEEGGWSNTARAFLTPQHHGRLIGMLRNLIEPREFDFADVPVVDLTRRCIVTFHVRHRTHGQLYSCQNFVRSVLGATEEQGHRTNFHLSVDAVH